MGEWGIMTLYFYNAQSGYNALLFQPTPVPSLRRKRTPHGGELLIKIFIWYQCSALIPKTCCSATLMSGRKGEWSRG